MTTSPRQILVLLCWLGSSSWQFDEVRNKILLLTTNIHPITVSHLRSSESHGPGPDVVSPEESILNFLSSLQVLQLSSEDLCILEEGRSRILSIVLDGSIISAMEVSVLKIKMWSWQNLCLVKGSPQSCQQRLATLRHWSHWFHHHRQTLQTSRTGHHDTEVLSEKTPWGRL